MAESLIPFGPDIWHCNGPTVTGAAGFRFPTRMVVIRLPDAGLWVWSPVALSDDLRLALAHLGLVTHLVAPNSLHDTFLHDWATAYPDAAVHLAPGLAPTAPGHHMLGDHPAPAWQDQIEQVVVRGNKITTEVVFFHRPSATVLITDLVQHIPRGWYRGWRAIVARLDLMTASTPSVSRKFRLATTDRNAARRSVKRILAWPSQQLIIAHGPLQSTGAQATLRQAFGWLVTETGPPRD